MSRVTHFVTATYKGETVYVSQTIGLDLRVITELTIERPAGVSERAAARVARSAARDAFPQQHPHDHRRLNP